jgi:Cu2+-exporting ATPase
MEHPITTGILQKVKELSVTVPSAENFNAITGKGVEVTRN